MNTCTRLLSISLSSRAARSYVPVPPEDALPNGDWYRRLHEAMMTGKPVDSSEHAAFFNELQVGCSSRFVYGASNQFEVAQHFLAKNPDARQNKSIIAPGEMGSIPKRNNFPPGLHLVLIVNAVDHFMVPLSEWREGEEDVMFRFLCDNRPDAEFLSQQGPCQTASLFCDGYEIRRVRYAVVEVGEDGWASVCHSDPALRKLTATLRENREAIE